MRTTQARLSLKEKYTPNKLEKLILFYRMNPVEAMRDLCLREPTWFQRIALRDMWDKPYGVWKWSRGASKCSKFNSLQYLADTGQYAKVQDLCGKNIKVLAMDENYKLVKADAKVEDNGLEECFDIKLRSGRSISVTSEHPLYTIDGWVETRELKKGDRVGVARQMPHVTQEVVGRSKARLLGYFIGDGGITSSVLFIKEDQSVLDDFQSCVLEKFPNHKCNTVKVKNRAKTLSVVSVGQHRNDVKNWLRDIDVHGKNAHHKIVPDCVYTWSLEDISNFIGAYYDCDGTVYRNNNSIGMTSVSEELLKGIQRLLLKLGILSSIKKINTSWTYKGIRKKSIAFVLLVHGQENVFRFVEKISTVSDKLSRLNMTKTKTKTNPNLDTIPKGIWQNYIDTYGIKMSSRKHSRSYHKECAPSREKLNKFGHEFSVEDALKLSESDIFWDEVESVTSIGLHQTYSTEVPGYHNFLADTVITHNTSLAALLLTLKAMLFPGLRIGALAPSYRQTQFIFDEIEELYYGSPYIRNSVRKTKTGSGIQKSTTKCRVDFLNGSFIEGLPLGKSENIRGRRYVFLFLDEYSQIPEDVIRMVIRPMLAIKRGGRRNQILRATTPFYKFNHFYELNERFKRLAQEEPDEYHHSSFNVLDVLIDNHKTFEPDLNIMKEAYNEDPEDIFQMEWLGIFPDETSGFFSSRLIDSCVPKSIDSLVPIEIFGDPSAEYIMGIDPARSEQGDLFAIVILKILKNKKRQVVKVITGRGKKFPEMADIIREEIYINKFNTIAINMDSRGGGKELQDLLEYPFVREGETYPPIIDVETVEFRDDISKVRPILHMMNFNTNIINDMYYRMKSDMERGNILFPVNIRRDSDERIETIGKEIVAFKNEMSVIQTKSVAYGLKFGVPKRFTKDRITACILANFAASFAEQEDPDKNAMAMKDFLSVGGWL